VFRPRCGSCRWCLPQGHLAAASLIFSFFLLPKLALGGEPASASPLNSVPTEIRISSTDWWPTAGGSNRSQYVGTAACAKCHAEKTASQLQTSMARAGFRAGDSELLRNNPDLSLHLGSYDYRLITKGANVTLSVTDGKDSTVKKLEWALGDGSFGQSYVYREDNKYYECQLSLYTRIHALDTTTGHMEPRTIQTAAGGLTSPKTIQLCFGCHSTASTANDRFDPDNAIMGVTCEACHGPGAQHVALMSMEGQNAKGSIFNPASLNPSDLVDFCGACHRTSADAVLAGAGRSGVNSVRMQPYRLEKSKCWGKGDARIACTACHDPHIQIVRDVASYDAKCLRCHLQKGTTRPTSGHAAACKVQTKNCVTCHMPEIEVPGTHTLFTDHWIRINEPGAPYPD
jgi:hypothetical protein